MDVVVDASVARWPAPAKLNLMLRIIGQRADGYHDLQTVFQFVDLCDWLEFTPRDDGVISVQPEISGVKEQDNLIFKAASLLRREYCSEKGVNIKLDKKIPSGAGLGGGSSDAATTLLALNQLWGLGQPLSVIAELSVQLGADVPVFVQGQNAWAEGVGEKLSPISLPDYWFVIVKPSCNIGTGKIFSSKYLTRNNKPITIADFIAGCDDNDCLDAVLMEYSEVADALSDLSVFARSRLTGTGSCVFASFEDEVEARKAQNKLLQKWKSVYVVRGLRESPVLQLVR